MAEVKNSFLGSKMNQDLDDRLIPNNQYREALNVAISNSEQSDVGAVETILGNVEIASLNSTIIGYVADEASDTIYLFCTNFADIPVQFGNIDNFAPTSAVCKIVSYGVLTKETKTLVEGHFLNFSTTNPIYGANIIEDLLFWTDNRNQPRKINVKTAFNDKNYYSSEDHISVAKYAPFQAIQMVEETSSGVYKTTMKDVVSPLLPDGTANPDYLEDESGDSAYAGDADYLQDKFVRFSYRFKFDDGEYSVFAPFTQTAFIPKQDGSFIDKYNASGDLESSDEENAYKSSLVSFMENKVNRIKLIVPLEFPAKDLNNKLKVISLEVLYKESDSTAVKLVEEIDFTAVDGNENYYAYDYQSTKPTKVLPSGQSTRVYDKVPVKALSQESTGNRIVYGNYVNKHTAPSVLDYAIASSEKFQSSNDHSSKSIEEYPQQTLKQNRNYQVGIVLSDRYGRSSGVILAKNSASLIFNNNDDFGSSTVYAPYKKEDPISFFGDSLKILFSEKIESDRNPYTEFRKPSETGEPGLYAESNDNKVKRVKIDEAGSNYADGQYSTETTAGSGEGLILSILTTSGSIKGVTVVSAGSGYQPGDTVELDGTTGTGAVFTVTELLQANPLGWYSYKVVVKQTEQEYYNVYAPNITSGSITTATASDQEKNIVFVPLISDNINKVPRNLEEVSPEQNQFSSDSILYPRVDTSGAASNAFNKMIDVTKKGSFVSTIASLNDITNNVNNSVNPSIYQAESNPFIAKISTPFDIGKPYHSTTTQCLSVFETEPVNSAIDIYWETSTSGLIEDLNYAIDSATPDAPKRFNDFNFNLTEGDASGTGVSSTNFVPENEVGLEFGSTAQLVSVTDFSVKREKSFSNQGRAADRTSEFSLYSGTSGYNIRTTNDSFYYAFDGETKEKYTFLIDVTNTDVTPNITKRLSLTGQLINVAPTITSSEKNIIYSGAPNPIVEFSGNNGAASSSKNQKDLVWTFKENGTSSLEVVKKNSKGVVTGAASFFLQKNSSGGGAELRYGSTRGYHEKLTGIYNLNIVLTDAGGKTDELTMEIDFTKGSFDAKQFSIAFNI